MPAKQKNDGIFGTPPEPMFNMQLHGLSREMLEDWLVNLAEENTLYMKNACKTKSQSPSQTQTQSQHFFQPRKTVEFVFQTCKKLKVPSQARYLAVEIFDSFIGQHIKELYSHVRDTKSKTKQTDWLGIQERVKSQVMLRVVTCCQLASKLTSHYKVVSPRRIKRFLEKAGQKYSTDSILQSELRILKTLKYKVEIRTPLVFVEILLEIVGHNETELPVKVYHGICLKILDLVYIQRPQVYQKLYLLAAGQNLEEAGKDIKMQFAMVENDFLLLSAAVISASSHVVDQGNTNVVVKQLSNITKITHDDIVDFATVLVQVILRGNEQ